MRVKSNKDGKYPAGQVTNNYAWIVAKRLGKVPPYRGYALDLQNGQLLANTPDGRFEIKDLPIIDFDGPVGGVDNYGSVQ